MRCVFRVETGLHRSAEALLMGGVLHFHWSPLAHVCVHRLRKGEMRFQQNLQTRILTLAEQAIWKEALCTRLAV